MPLQRRTSESDPIEVFWVDRAAHGTAGRLGLTFAPGKKGAGAATGATWDRDLATDLDRLRHHHGVDLLVSLMEGFEYRLLGVPDLLDEARARGIEVLRLPIVDGSVPRPGDLPEVRELVRSVREAMLAGRTAVIHCRGGQGRTGTIAALVVATFGHEPREAIGIVREAQPWAVENPLQERYVEETAPLLRALPGEAR
ncbi:MAG TPA: cyclin-dependent kinase inhibitor 3 family protein [Trueperaceae bacterium]